MKVLLVGPRFHTNQFQMVKTLSECGHEVFFHVASLGATEDHTLLTPTRYKQSKLSVLAEKVFGHGGVNHPNYFPVISEYWKAIRHMKPDVVIIRDPQRPFSLLAALCSRLAKAKIVFYTQEDLFRYRSSKTKMKQQLLISAFKAAWMVPIRSEQQPQGSSLKHMYYVPLPIPINISGRTGKTGQEIRLLMIGKYNQKRKNHLLLVDAIHHLKNKYNFKVTMVGECARENQHAGFDSIREKVKTLGLEDIVEMKKDIPYNKIGALYQSHDVFVLPAVDEQYGISVTEALGYGMPVICTDTCGARFNIQHGINGLIIKSNSLSDLIQALETIFSNPLIHHQMEKKSGEYVQSNLSGQAFYQRFSSLVNERFHMKCGDTLPPRAFNF